MKLKKRIVSLAVVIALFAIAAVGTLAYFTDEGTAHNIITTGKIDIVLNDDTLDENGQLVEFPEAGIPGVMPGADVDKIVSVTNKSDGDAWVRIVVDQNVMKDGVALDATVKNDAGEEIPAIVINFCEDTKWMQGTDGNWYYTEAVAPEATTERLFESVSFAPEMGNEFQGCTINIVVTAQAVQVKNNEIPEGGTVENVAGWPEA